MDKSGSSFTVCGNFVGSYHTNSNLVKAKNILADSFELVYEVEIPETNSNKVIETIFELGGIDSVNLLAQNA